jgi:DNA-binding NarL/FixJ family response regulator
MTGIGIARGVSRMRVLVADSRSKVRFALRTLLTECPEVDLAGEASDAEELVHLVQADCPDLILLDWELQGMVAAPLLVTLRASCPALHIVVLSGRPEVRRTALAVGADAFISKADPPEGLLAVIRSARPTDGTGSRAKGDHRL